MGLYELNDELHSREVHRRVRENDAFEPTLQQSEATDTARQFQTDGQWRENTPDAETIQKNSLRATRRRKIALALGILAGILVIGGIVVKIRGMLFDEKRVTISFEGPQKVGSGEITTYTVAYTNDNWATLQDATLVLTYPDTFHIETDGTMKTSLSKAEIPVGDIGKNTTGKVTVAGKFYGSRGELAYLNAFFQYTPSNVSSRFEATAQLGVNIASSPVVVELSAPLEVASGQEVEYVVDYGNHSDQTLPRLRVKLDYPDGFRFLSAEPRPSEGESVWYIGDLTANAGNKIRIRGILSGMRDEQKNVKASIGYHQGNGDFIAYHQNERITKIVASPLSLYQTVNGLTEATADPGEILYYTIRYQNTGDIGVRDAIVTLAINSPFLDFSRLELKSGSYDASRKMIVWKASDVPGLGRIEPGGGGEITFSIPVRETVESQGTEKNFSIQTVATIDSPDIPTPVGANKIIGSNTLVIKISAAIHFQILGFYQDALFPNTGPVPPMVGKETTYTLHIRVVNSSNDVGQSKVSVLLPSGVRYMGKSFPDKETVVFNERTNELVWEIGTLAPGRAAGRELVFQVAVVPNESHIGKPLELVRGATFIGEDLFTRQPIKIELPAKTNYLEEDQSLKFQGHQVVPAS